MADILIADDHDLVRDTIAAYLGAAAGFHIRTAASLDEAIALLAGSDRPVDLVILDYDMPGMNGLDGICRLNDRFPGIRIALMSGVANRDTAARALARGARGYFPKSLSVQAMVAGIRALLAGDTFAPFDLTASPAHDSEWGLTPREFEVLGQLSTGAANRDIANALGLKEVTVKLHVKNLMAKMQVANRTQAALMAREKQLF